MAALAVPAAVEMTLCGLRRFANVRPAKSRQICRPRILVDSKETIVSHSGSTSNGRPKLIDSKYAAGVLAWSLLFASGCGLASSGMNAEGTRFFQQGNHAAAIRRFERAITANPHDADSYYNLAATYHQLARSGTDNSYWATAETYYNQCLDIAANHKPCHRGLAVLLAQQNRQQQSFRLLEGWRDRNPFSPEPKIELARLYEEVGEIAESERQLLEAIATDTTNARARAALGKLRDSQGDISQALANYRVSLSRNFSQPQLRARVAALTSSGVNALPSVPAANGGSRTVTIPPSTIRY